MSEGVSMETKREGCFPSEVASALVLSKGPFSSSGDGEVAGSNRNRVGQTEAVSSAQIPSPIPLEALNVGYAASSSCSSQLVVEGGMEGGSECVLPVAAVGENSNDACSIAPETPQRAPEQNPGTPLTPLANLKVLIAAAAASSALDRERECASIGKGSAPSVGCGEGEEEGAGRKMKSLALLCKKFLSIVENDVGAGNEFSLEMMAQSLGINRRRIYDIINALEALEMIVKQSKNWYTWLGRAGLTTTLAKLRAMALDDPEFHFLFEKSEADKENCDPGSLRVESGGVASCSEGPLPVEEGGEYIGTSEGDMIPRGGRWDKSLGVLCQKFIMLFFVSPNHELTLDFAGGVLIPDEQEERGHLFSTIHAPPNPKAKVRRLYDIANVLTTLGLIKKKTFLAPNHRKMPGYMWSGPSMSEIEAIPVSRKSDSTGAPLYSKKRSGPPLTRKPSLNSRPFLHQYEVKDSHNSAPSTPTKTREGGFRRSLSFGAPTAKPATVLARPLCPRQLEYMKEVKEFEAEMQKHSHRYPHVASVFHEFIQKYQSTLEQAASSGRLILPKPVPGTDSSGSPSRILSPAELLSSILASPQGLAALSSSTSSGSSPETSIPFGSVSVAQSPANVSEATVNLTTSQTDAIKIESTSSGACFLQSTSHPTSGIGIASLVSPALPVSSPNAAATFNAALQSSISPPQGSRLYRRILPAPTRDNTTPAIIQKASEIVNRTATAFTATGLPRSGATPNNGDGANTTAVCPVPSSGISLSTSTVNAPTAGNVVTTTTPAARPSRRRATATARAYSDTSTAPTISSSPEQSLGSRKTPPRKTNTDPKANATNAATPVFSVTTSQAQGATASPVPGLKKVTTKSKTPASHNSTSATQNTNTTIFNNGAVSAFSPVQIAMAPASMQATAISIQPAALPKQIGDSSHLYTSASAHLPACTGLSKHVGVSPTVPSSSTEPDNRFVPISSASILPTSVQLGGAVCTALSSEGNMGGGPTLTNWGATRGTLQSPSRSAQSFISVENFLVPVHANTTQRVSLGQEVAKPTADARISFSSASVSPPCGVQALSNIPSSGTPLEKPHSAFTPVVNQKSVPSPFEGNQTQQQPANGSMTALTFDVVNPNIFLVPGPTANVTSPLFASGGSLYPLTSGFLLPPFNFFAKGHTGHLQAPNQSASSLDTNDSSTPNSEPSPPKKPRLE